MYVRIYRRNDDRELLLNVDHVSKIEVGYSVPGDKGDYWCTTVADGQTDPSARKIYTVFVGGESYTLSANPDDPVMQVIEGIYKSAVKA